MIKSLLFFLSFAFSVSAQEEERQGFFLSFIVPCCNCEQTIEKTIQSIYNQQLDIPFEVICVENFSTDHTKRVLEKCAENFPNLKSYSYDRRKLEMGGLRNACTLYTKGNLLFNLDPGSILSMGSVKKLIALMQKTGCDVASFNHVRFFEENYVEVNRQEYCVPGFTWDLRKFIDYEALFPSHQGIYLYTRECFNLVGGYPEDCGTLDTRAFGLSLLATGCRITAHSSPEVFYWQQERQSTKNENYPNDFRRALRHISEVFSNEFSSLLFNSQCAKECLDYWTQKKNILISEKVLELLCKASQHKKKGQYAESSDLFDQALQNGLCSEKIYRNMQNLSHLALQAASHDAVDTASSYVTYAFDSGGRFGDQLMNVIKAEWISWKYGIPLLYRPFLYSDQLNISNVYEQMHILDYRKLQSVVRVANDGNFQEMKRVLSILEQEKKEKAGTLYVISYYSHVSYDNDWDNEKFRRHIAKLIRPIQPIKSLKPPLGYVTVALHVRSRENGFDAKKDIEKMRTKFPPDSFYLNGLKEIAKFFKSKPLYIYIFTDDPDPKRIRDAYIKKINDWGIRNEITICCRETENSHGVNVLEDFFAMMEFDCIIHPDSMFSLVASFISGPIIEVTPPFWHDCRKDEHHNTVRDKEGEVIIDNCIYFRPKKGKPIEKALVAPIEPSMLF